MHVCRYYHDDPLPEDLRQELEDEMYRALLMSHDEHDAPDVAQSDASPDVPQGAAPPDVEARPIRRTLERLLSVADFNRYSRANERLSERLAHEAVHWVGHRWDAIAGTPSLAAESDAIASFATEKNAAALEALAQEAVDTRPALAGAARAVLRAENDEPIESSIHRQRWLELDRRTRHAYLIKQWRTLHAQALSDHQERELGRAIGDFIRELRTLVPKIARQQQLVRDIFGNEDALFDLSRHEWENLPTEGLEAAARTLGHHEELHRLAESIGRSRLVSESRRVLRTHHRVRERYAGVGKSEIVGVRHGNDTESLMPSEVALLADPVTQELFYARLAKSELMVLDYKQRRLVRDVVERPVWLREDVLVPRGPVIVCVDTSGSMLGTPERIAKGAVLALAARLRRERRQMEVVAFSTDVRSFSLDFVRTDLPELSRFLSGSFHGGTDLTKALVAALTALESRSLEHADVLVISDFKVPKLADRHIGRISRQHRKGTLFHSLTVSTGSVIDPLHIFDTTWHFDTRSGRMKADAATP